MTENLYVRKITDSSHLEKITNWMYDWWGEREGYSYNAVKASMSRSLQEERLPQTYGLFLGSDLIGMYQFTNSDLFPCPDIYPWLANVYIDTAFRKKGYGKYLLSTVKENAEKSLSSDELFLFTYHKGLYEKFGWEPVSQVETFLKPNIQSLYRLRLG